MATLLGFVVAAIVIIPMRRWPSGPQFLDKPSFLILDDESDKAVAVFLDQHRLRDSGLTTEVVERGYRALTEAMWHDIASFLAENLVGSIARAAFGGGTDEFTKGIPIPVDDIPHGAAVHDLILASRIYEVRMLPDGGYEILKEITVHRK